MNARRNCNKNRAILLPTSVFFSSPFPFMFEFNRQNFKFWITSKRFVYKEKKKKERKNQVFFEHRSTHWKVVDISMDVIIFIVKRSNKPFSFFFFLENRNFFFNVDNRVADTVDEILPFVYFSEKKKEDHNN